MILQANQAINIRFIKHDPIKPTNQPTKTTKPAIAALIRPHA